MPNKFYRKPKPATTNGRYPFLRFLARQGGLAPCAELEAMDLHRLFLPGFGMLVRMREKGGMTLDQARGVADEAGYFENGMRARVFWNDEPPQTDISDLLDLIAEDFSERRRVLPVGDHEERDADPDRDRHEIEAALVETLGDEPVNQDHIDAAVEYVLATRETNPAKALRAAALMLEE